MVEGMFFLLIATLFSTNLWAQDWNSPTWHNLLHYRRTFYGALQSQADGMNFFFSPEGVSSPEKEWNATIEAMSNKQILSDEMAHCRFPARAMYLSKLKKIAPVDFSQCPGYLHFKQLVNPKGLSLIFSTYYLDNPASAFGHTLLRFHRNSNTQNSSDLLDYATNYAASVTTGNAFLYAFLGLIGGFKGEFASMPYFYKIREYNDFESRDLWDYELDLTQEQIDMVLAHIWEMRQTFFSYLYLTENCSYHMLGLLDVANENWRLTKRTPLIAIPVQTVQTVVDTPGLVKAIHFRPSKRRFLEKRLHQLNQQEKDQFKNLIEANYDASSLDTTMDLPTKAKILDVAIDHIDFFQAKEVLLEKSQAAKTKHQLLVARGKTGIKAQDVTIEDPVDERPDLSHGSRRLSLASYFANRQGFGQKIEYRFALHDYTDPWQGQNPDATMEIFKVRLNYIPHNRQRGRTSSLRVDDFSLVQVYSFRPLKEFFKSVSWLADFGAKTIQSYACEYCFVPSAVVGAGLSVRIKKLLLGTFLTSEINIGSKVSHEGARVGMGPMALAALEILPGWRMQAKGQARYFEFSRQDWEYSWEALNAVDLAKWLSLKSSYTRFQRQSQVLVSLDFYH